MWFLPVLTIALSALFVWLMRIWQRWWARTLLVSIAIPLAIPLLIFLSLDIHEVHMKLRVRDINARLEGYLATRGQYPANLAEVGVPQDLCDTIQYEHTFDPPAYNLSFEYFPYSLTTYYSDKKSWEYY